MKKSIVVLALAVALVLAFSASAFAVGPFMLTTGATWNNAVAPGYLSWGYAKSTLGQTGTPHGGYTTTSTKCQVCHATHRAQAGGSVLTAIPSATFNLNTTDPSDNIGSSNPNGYTKGCGWCHGVGGFATTIAMGADGSIAPHSNCNRCHTASPHGAEASEFAVLNQYLINEDPDAAIKADMAASANGLTPSTTMFDDESDAQALALGTGYLCNVCHGGGSTAGNSLVFAVNTPGATPARNAEVGSSFVLGTSAVTGHRVTAEDTTNWNQQGYTLPAAAGSVPASFSAYYTGGGAAGATSQIAWAPANSCKACHDQKLASGLNAFPHGYVDNSGAYIGNVNGASYIWMRTGSSAASATVGLAKTGDATQGNALLGSDGTCLKCHVKDGNGTDGVGESF